MAAREEIAGSKKRLEDIFGVPIRHFCYPFGEWNERVCDIVVEAGYTTACTMMFGINTAATSPFELRRVSPLSWSRLVGKTLHRARQSISRRIVRLHQQ